MRLLYLNHNVVWRSTFYRCYHFGRQLVRRGHEVTLVTIAPERTHGIASYGLDGVRVVEMPDLLRGMGRSGWDPWDTLNRLWWLRAGAFDLVHAFDCRPVVILPALYLQRQHGLPLVIDWADWWGRGGVIEERRNPWLKPLFGGIETWWEEAFRRQADRTTVISTALGERAAHLGVPRATIHHIVSGADIESIRPLDRDQARAALGLPLDGKLVTFVGAVHYDLDLVLRAFRELAQDVPDVRLVLVGPKSPLAAELIPEDSLRARVLEVGPRPFGELPRWLGAADVLLLPFADKIANVGRWPNKVGDYMAAGRPTVSNPTGEMRPLFERERIGLLAPPGPGPFAQAVRHLLDDPSLAAELGANARRAAEQRYAWSVLVEQMEAVYEGVRSQEPGASRG